MSVRGARAVVASAFPGDAQTLAALLASIGFTEIAQVRDGAEALDCVRNRLPELLVADMVLPVLDGVSLAERVTCMPLTVYPAIVLTTVPGLSGRVVPAGCEVLTKPVDRERLRGAISGMRPESRAVPERIRRGAGELLDAVGVPDHCGRAYLLRAIEMTWCDAGMARSLTGRLYPAVAREHCADPRHVERAVRHVIDVAWRSGEIEAQYRIFGDTIDAKRGNPTCGEMIAQIADILRWEGRA